ncbi:hypothetical protein COU76_04570 [Candidatus Peregrinibacteria bacterium CG10_big_fil_rev_8_21_14_0_10_49_10]|nr:MAG: hypothetical protein COU76_04570 [Candidatus Peregrinibacteria bacterium CG10_big_fil_rev_8_21_14_0_10_49_10]
MKRFILLIGFLLVPGILFARSYGVITLRYSDVRSGTNSAVAISTLTQMGVVEGNPDGTFRPLNSLNRAEFVKIVMGLVPDDGTPYGLSCFTDVSPNVWYAVPVCRAKALGIVSGNDLPGAPAGDRPFAAERSVNVAEAVKILVEVFDIPVQVQAPQEPWYAGYFAAAFPVLQADPVFDFRNADLASDNLAGITLSRADMARLTVAFVANASGELAAYRTAEAQQSTSSSSSFVSSNVTVSLSASSSSSSPSLSSLSSSTSSVSSPAVSYDPDSNVSQYNNVLLLGDDASPVLAGVNVFSDTEPLNLNSVTINLNTSVSSIDSLLVYDHVGAYLGRAFRESGGTYILSVKNSHITIPRREDYSFYIRARLKPFTLGGVSGESFTVSSVTVEGDGGWSNRSYTKNSSDTFPLFQTARSRITTISNPDSGRDVLSEGTDLTIGSYLFSGKRGDGQADVAVTDITFTLSSVGGVTVSNIELMRQGIDSRHSCSLSSFRITCSAIPDTIGSFEDGPLILELKADVSIPGNALKASLSASINQPGSPSSAGDITWTDGSESLTWVPFGSPVVRGTYYEQ